MLRNLKGWIIYMSVGAVFIYFGLNNYHFIRYNLFILSLIALCLGMTVLFWIFFHQNSGD